MVDPENLDAVFVSHLHEDHMAMIPYLVRRGYSEPIYMTRPTRELGVKQWVEWARILEEDGRSLYSVTDAVNAERLIREVRYGDVIEIGDLRITIGLAGHALGSAHFLVEEKKGKKLLYLADVNKGSHVLRDFEEPKTRPDAMIINASYGDNIIDMEATKRKLAEILGHTLLEGSVLFPVTPTGRAQETLMILYSIRDKIKDTTIIATEKIRKATETLNKYQGELKETYMEQIREVLEDIVFAKEEEILEAAGKPGYIILAEDLMMMGFSRRIFMEIKDDPRSAVIHTGYKAPGTFARQLVMARNTMCFTWNSEPLVFRTRVYDIPIKMHFDLHDNISLVESMGRPLLILHHGEEPRSLRLALALSNYVEPKRILLPSTPSKTFLG